MGYTRGIEWKNVNVLCSKFTPTAFLMLRFITQLKSILSGAPVALVVLNHVSVCSISYGLISIKLADNDVVFHSQERRIHHLPRCSDDPCLLWLLANIFFFYIYLFREGSSSDHIHTVTHIHNWKLPNLICWQLIGVGVKGLAQWHFSDGNEGGVSAIFFTFPTQIFPAGLGDWTGDPTVTSSLL